MIRTAEQTRERKHVEWVVATQERHADRLKHLQKLIDDAPAGVTHVELEVPVLLQDFKDFARYLRGLGYCVKPTGKFNSRTQHWSVQVDWGTV